MTASGPFAFGSTAASHTPTRRSVPKSNFPQRSVGPSLVPQVKVEDGTTAVAAASGDLGEHGADDVVYSDPEDGVEIVDMEDVQYMDWMAPDSLLKEKEDTKRLKLGLKLKSGSHSGKGKGMSL